MKTLRVLKAGIAVFVIFLCWSNSTHAGPSLWPGNKGEICLQNNSTGDFVRLAVFRTIANHYIVHGFVTEGSGSKTLFNGNAIVDGNSILIHISASGYKTPEGETYGFIGRVVLDAGTLTGWLVGVGFHCMGNEEDDDCDFGYDGIQELVAAPCP